MASKLEALVNSRIHGRSGKELLLDEPVIYQEQELHHCPHQEFGRAYKEFYSNLKATISDDDNDDDHAKSFQLLENARSIAKTLVSR